MAEQPQQQQQQPSEPDRQPELAAVQQWEGVVEARLPSTPAAAAWPHLASFCALHRYLPGIDVCELVAGEDGLPGCVRYVASRRPQPSPPLPPEDGDDQDLQVQEEGAADDVVDKWAREELLERDDARRRLVYAVVGSNMGFGRYVATFTVVDLEEEEVVVEEQPTSPAPAGPAGCRLVWAFECEPVQGWNRDGLVGYLDASIKGMAERIECAVAIPEAEHDEDATACS